MIAAALRLLPGHRRPVVSRFKVHPGVRFPCFFPIRAVGDQQLGRTGEVLHRGVRRNAVLEQNHGDEFKARFGIWVELPDRNAVIGQVSQVDQRAKGIVVLQPLERTPFLESLP